MTPVSRGRPRFWLLYVAAWTPLTAIYALLISRPGVSIGASIIGSLTTVVPAVIFGAIVVRLTEWISDRETTRARFLVLHTLFGAAFAILWWTSTVASIYWGAPRSVFDNFMREGAGWQFVTGLLLYTLIAGVVVALRSSHRLQEQQAAAARSDALRVRAELQALRAQLNPHFLFNTLHSVIALVRRDPPMAEAALERFGNLLRYVLDVNRDLLDEVAVADELNFVRTYLSLEALRLGDRLHVDELVEPDALDCLIPSFTLQPLVENAIRHGIAPNARGGTLRIKAWLESERLVLEVSDNGIGAAAETLAAADGLGLRAVRQRLEARYGDRATFGLTTLPGAGFAVRVSLPAASSLRTPDRGHLSPASRASAG